MPIAPRSAEELLLGDRILARLPSEDIRCLAAIAELRHANRGKPLFCEGERAEGLFVVRTGQVKVSKGGGPRHREQIVYLARPGRPIVEGLRFDNGAYPASAVAMRATSALLFPNEAVVRLSAERPALLHAMLDLRAHREDRLLDLVADLALRTVPSRLASFLCSQVSARHARGEDDRYLVRELTTETVAGRLGTVREEISRGLAQLERKGALKVSPDVIEIVDMEALERIAYGAPRSG